MITKFVLIDEVIQVNYGLPFLYRGMTVKVNKIDYKVLESVYDSDKNEQIVYLFYKVAQC